MFLEFKFDKRDKTNSIIFMHICIFLDLLGRQILAQSWWDAKLFSAIAGPGQAENLQSIQYLLFHPWCIFDSLKRTALPVKRKIPKNEHKETICIQKTFSAAILRNSSVWVYVTVKTWCIKNKGLKIRIFQQGKSASVNPKVDFISKYFHSLPKSKYTQKMWC